MDASELRRIRDLPLEAVLEGFGARRDPKDPRHNWKAPGSRITVTASLFYDHNQGKGGGGALDLTLHLMGRDFKHPSAADFREAARWLGAAEHVMQAASRPTSVRSDAPPENADRPAELPVPDASRIARVRWYLTQRRALPTALVDQAIERGDVFADGRANVVFRLRDESGQEIGFEKRGSSDRPFHSVFGEKGLFFTGSGTGRVAAFVESGIEALSYRALRGDAVLSISTTGNAVERPDRMARLLRERDFRLVAAFNADRDGDRFAERFAQQLGGTVERDRPDTAKDWNQILQARRDHPERAQTPGATAPARRLELTR
jgi:hypothetical protein